MIKNPEGFRYDDSSHRYYIGDRPIVGITEALSICGITQDYSRLNRSVLANAANRGTAVHLLTQLLDENDLGEYDLNQEGYLKAYEAFKKEWEFVPEVIERVMAHPFYFFAGRPDRGGLIRGKKAVVEIKTTKEIDDAVELQVAGQQILLEHYGYGPILLRLAVALRDDGTYVVRTFKDIQAKTLFLSAVAIASWRINHKRG